LGTNFSADVLIVEVVAVKRVHNGIAYDGYKLETSAKLGLKITVH
jgi:hypothetical protein